MRLWSVHPKYLDRQGLLACWREGLGALKALKAWSIREECGYQNHPQLNRFKKSDFPVYLLYTFNETIYQESIVRGYNFDKSRLNGFIGDCDIGINKSDVKRIEVTTGQIRYESEYLLPIKLKSRKMGVDSERLSILQKDIENNCINLNSVFKIVEGAIESWEKIKKNIE